MKYILVLLALCLSLEAHQNWFDPNPVWESEFRGQYVYDAPNGCVIYRDHWYLPRDVVHHPACPCKKGVVYPMPPQPPSGGYMWMMEHQQRNTH